MSENRPTKRHRHRDYAEVARQGEFVTALRAFLGFDPLPNSKGPICTRCVRGKCKVHMRRTAA